MRERAHKAASTARKSYARHCNRRVRQQLIFSRGDVVYIDSLPVVKVRKVAMPEKDSSRKIQPKKDGQYPDIKASDHTLKVDINEIHNVMSIERVSLTKTNEEALPSNTLVSPAKLDEVLHTDECLSQHSVYDKEASK